MTSLPSLGSADPLTVAADADRHLWDLTQLHPSQWLAVRDQAVRDAVAAGHSREEIAETLGVMPSDIDRMTATHP